MNNVVNIKVAGNDTLSFIEQLKQKTNQLTAEMISNARKQADSSKDQLKIIEQEIKAIERRNKIDSEGTRRGAVEARNAAKRNNEDEYNSVVSTIKGSSVLSSKQKYDQIRGAQETRTTKDEQADQNLKDQLIAAREQERISILQTKLLKDNVEAVKMAATQELMQMKKGDAAIIKELDDNSQPTEKLARELTTEEYKKETKEEKPPKEEEKERTEGTFAGFMKALAFEKGLGLVSQMPNAKNELDFVKPISSIVGMMIGGLMGNVMDAIEGISIFGNKAGQTNFAALGTQLGEKAGEMFGNTLDRAYKGREGLSDANFRLQAMSGKNMGIDTFGGANGLGGTGMAKLTTDLTKYGLSMQQTAELQYKVATASGSSRTMNKDAENVIALQEAAAVSQETSQGLMELMRSSKEGNRDIMKLVGGVMQAGQGNIFKGDRTFLNEFLQKNFTTLQKQLLSHSETVSSGTTFDILKKFDALGGAFSARDPRSGAMIGQINNSLVNPGSDVLKAYSFMALRRNNPGMGIADLDVEREKGLGSPAYLKAMLQQVDMLGGDDQIKRKNIAGMFGINASAAKRLFENRKGLMSGDISTKELLGTGEFGEEGIRKTGEDQTNKYTRSTAEIENAFVKDVASAIGVVGEKMKSLFGDMTDELKAYIIAQLKPGSGDNAVQKNKTPTLANTQAWVNTHGY